MQPVNFVLVVHNHQPVGNFDHIVEEAYRRAYLPFVETMAKYPAVPFGLHISGPLWEWIDRRQPEFWELIGDLISRGQVELIGGGFYEPILPILPMRDQIGQIKLMSRVIRERFGVVPTGLWTTERIWEPQLPEPLDRAGIRYTFLDDTHFHSAGFNNRDLDGLYITSHSSHRVILFPISQSMRYAVPFKPPEEALNAILAVQRPDRETLICLADDGEKFGLWPGTYGTCYEERWLEKFLELLLANGQSIRTILPCDAVKRLRPLGRAYLPTASYFEMTEWALPLDRSHELTTLRNSLKESGAFESLLPYLKGGHWRNFFTKYEESVRIYERMLKVSRRVADLPDDFPEKGEAVRALYRAQCNCAYWHGIFGGLYLPHLRGALWENIIIADTICNRNSPPRIVELADIDGDGSDEIRLNGPDIAVTVRADDGRLDDLELTFPAINLLDTLSRRPEAYHRNIASAVKSVDSAKSSIHSELRVKESGLENLLVYDPYPRRAGIEHFIQSGATIDDFDRGLTRIKTASTSAPYIAADQVTIDLAGEFGGANINFNKIYRISSETRRLELAYNFQTPPAPGGKFGVEWCINLRDGHSGQSFVEINGGSCAKPFLDSVDRAVNVNYVDLVCRWLPVRVRLEFSPPVELWRAPLQTVSASESGLERVFQGTMLLALWGGDEIQRCTTNLTVLSV